MRVKMRVRGRAGALAAAVVVAAGAWVAVGGGGPAGAATLPGGTWGLGQPMSGFGAVNWVTCTAPGDCVAVGYSVTGSGSTAADTPVVATETAGTWGSAQPVSGTAGLGSGTSAGLDKVSCGATGDCTAVGAYHGTDGRGHAFYVSETAGAWGTATAVSEAGQPAGTYSAVTGVSCPAAGYCAIAGNYTTVTTTTSSTGTTTTSTTVTPFLLDEAGGNWDAPQPVPGLSSLPSAGSSAILKSVSCAAPGECTVVGGYETSGGTDQPFVVSETAGTGGTAGTWGSAQQVPVTGMLAFITSVSCPDAADCTAAGIYQDSSHHTQPFTVDEQQGTWGTADLLGNASLLGMEPPMLACASAGDCVLASTAGIVTGPNAAHTGAVADSETSSGGWGNVTPIAVPASTVRGTVTLSYAGGVSCVPGGDCTIAGYYNTATGPNPVHMFAVTSTGGVLGTVQPLVPATAGSPSIKGLSCPQDGYCTLAYGLGGVPEVVSEATAATVTLAASAPQVTYGSEPAETFTATVSSPAGGTPTGTVAVTGPAGYAGGSGGTLCTITLAGGTGSCSFTPSPQFPGGTSTLTATYSGDATYTAASGTASVTVARAASITTASVSPAQVALFTGTETFSAAVTAQTAAGAGAALPTGNTTVTFDGMQIANCAVLPLSNGKDNCASEVPTVPPGQYKVTISYSGDGNYQPSTSAPVSVTVTAPAVAVGAAGGDGALWAQAPQLGGGWHSLGGKITAPPAVAAVPSPDGTAPAQPLFIAAGANHELYLRSLTAGWQLLGPHTGSCLGAPAAVITGGTLTVACRGLNNALWENSTPLPSAGLPQFTGGWTSLGGVLTAGPAAAPAGGVMTFFVRGTNGHIYTRTLTSGYKATPWECLGSPAAAADPADGGTTLAFQGTNHALWEAVNGGSGWAGAVSLGGALVGGPAMAVGRGGFEFLVEGTNHAVWQRIPPAGWASLGGTVVGGVGTVALN